MSARSNARRRGRSLGIAALSAALAAQLGGAAPLGAQDAETVIETVIARHAERLAHVDDYTLIQRLQGIQGADAPVYFERVEGEGFPVFRIVPPHEYQGDALKEAGLTGVPTSPGAGGGSLGSPIGAMPGLPVALPSPGTGGESLLEKLGGAALGGATGGLQQQLTQQGMQGLMNLATPGADDGGGNGASMVAVLEALARSARLEGTEIVDGAECHVVRSNGIHDPELERQMAGGADLTLTSITMWIDVTEYVPRRTVAEGTVMLEGKLQAIHLDLLYQDYRQVDGMYEPFRRVIRMPGMMDPLASADPERAEQIREDTRGSLAKMEKLDEMLAQMPPEQRRMVEAQMGAARQRLEKFTDGDSGEMETVLELQELRVNEGPPSPFGTGSLTAEGDMGLELPHMIAQAFPESDVSGRVAGWMIRLLGATEGEARGEVQLRLPVPLPAAGPAEADGGLSVLWVDGTQARLVAPPGEARITITLLDERRIAGEFRFEGTGRSGSPTEAPSASSTVRGRFDAPLPAGILGPAPTSLVPEDHRADPGQP
jgi:hypothetical protein